MEIKINFIFICCIIITIMFTIATIFAIIDTIKKDKKTKENKQLFSDSNFEDLLIEFDEMSFITGTTCPNPKKYAIDYKKRLISAINNNNKETLKRIINEINDKLYDFDIDCSYYEKKTYYAVCRIINDKVLNPIAKKHDIKINSRN